MRFDEKFFFQTVSTKDVSFRNELLQAPARLAWRIWYELVVVWKFIYIDIPASLGFGVMWSICAWSVSSLSWYSLPFVLAKSIFYFTVYVLPHCIANQISGFEEDKINKPFRLLPSGQLSMEGAWIRLGFAFMMLLVVGWYDGIFWWALSWDLIVLVNNFSSHTNKWYVKDLWMGLGMVVLMGAAWELVLPMNTDCLIWIGSLSSFVFVLVPMQDLRDMDGDAARGRKTFPLAFGEQRCRQFLALSFFAMPLVFYVMLLGKHVTVATMTWWTFLGLWAWGLSFSVWNLRDTKSDHYTYQAFCWWFVAWEASAISVL